MADTIWTHVGMCVSDIGKTQKFYEEVFGFKKESEFDVRGDLFAKFMRLPPPLLVKQMMLSKDGFKLELLGPVTPSPTLWQERQLNNPGLTHLGTRATNMEEFKKKVVQYGGQVLEESTIPASIPGLGGSCYVRDPNGQLIAVFNAAPAPAPK